MDKLKSKKTTFMMLGSNKDKIKEITDYTTNTYDKKINTTDIINISISELLKHIEKPEDIKQYLIKYNKL